MNDSKYRTFKTDRSTTKRILALKALQLKKISVICIFLAVFDHIFICASWDPDQDPIACLPAVNYQCIHHFLILAWIKIQIVQKLTTYEIKLRNSLSSSQISCRQAQETLKDSVIDKAAIETAELRRKEKKCLNQRTLLLQL